MRQAAVQNKIDRQRQIINRAPAASLSWFSKHVDLKPGRLISAVEINSSSSSGALESPVAGEELHS